MENNSVSQTSPDSPIVYQPDSFKPGRSALVLLGAIGALIAGLVVSGIGAVVAVHGDVGILRTNMVVAAVGMQGVMDLFVVIFLLLTLPWLAQTSLRGLGFWMPDARTIGIAILGAVAMIVVVNGSGTIIDTLLHSKHQQQAIQLFLSERNTGARVFLAFLAVIIAPFAEELTFRVFIFNAVRRWQPFWIAATVSGILFGLAHTDLYALVPLLFGGIILCFVYTRSKNAFASMITHALFNGVTVALLFFVPSMSK